MLEEMSHRFTALVIVLGAFVSIASLAATWVGVTDWLVASSGGHRRVAAEALASDARGWFTVDGCVRHDYAVVVTEEGVVYRLGEKGPAPEEGDRTFTPLATRDDCDEDHLPRRVYALVEDAEATDTTLGRTAPTLVAPPPIVARVDGTIGPRVGDASRAQKGRQKLEGVLAGIAQAPLLKKGGRPADRTVAALTAAIGLHGLLFLALGARWLRRKRQREQAMREGRIDEAEEHFFRTETLD
jgi:hypothetical protein